MLFRLVCLASLLLAVAVNTILAKPASKPVLISSSSMSAGQTKFDIYKLLRAEYYQTQLQRSVGYKLTLNANEIRANETIMRFKRAELDEGFKDPHKFAPSRHFFEVLDQVNESKLFQILRRMPKGGVLHAHDTALLSTDKVVNLTYRANLWMCGDIFKEVPKFIFAKSQPNSMNGIEWKLVSEERKKAGNDVFDKTMRKIFTLYTKEPGQEFKDINNVWNRFMKIFISLDPIVTYVEVWKEYFYESLKEFLADGVQYLEFRGLLPEIYDLDGKKYNQIETAGMYVEVLQKFMSEPEHSDFIGCKFIFAPIRFVNQTGLDIYLNTYKKLKDTYPNFIAGFDLVGQEDIGGPLKIYAEKLLEFPDGTNFFYHAGETNWNGMDTDENLIDAIALGTKRIGHGYALLKHPKMMELVKEKQICIEVNPLSNQVLKLVQDYRNHPLAALLADDYPVVVSCDDPSFWEGLPLSHDFYMTFLGIASAHHDLRLLKQLALNSIRYSSLNKTEQEQGLSKWSKKWDEFIDFVIKFGEKNKN